MSTQEQSRVTPVNHSETDSVANPNRKKKIVTAISAGVATLLAGGALVVGLNAGPKTDTEPPVTDPVPTEPAETPEITPGNPVGEPQLSFKPEEGIEVSKINNFEELGMTRTDAYSSWMNAGSTAENVQEAYSLSNPLNIEEFAQKIANENASVFTESLFVSDWQSNPKLVDVQKRLVNNNKNTLNLFFITNNISGSNPEDKVPYKRYLEVRSDNGAPLYNIMENPDGSVNIITYEVDVDNSSMNRANELTGGQLETSPIYVNTTWVQESGHWKISNIEVVDSINSF